MNSYLSQRDGHWMQIFNQILVFLPLMGAAQDDKKKNMFLLHQQKDKMGRKAPTPKYIYDILYIY